MFAAFLALCVIATTADEPKLSEAAQKEVKKLEGKWKAVKAVTSGLEETPEMDGAEVIRKVREWTGTPIIVLSARDQEGVKVAALDLGADDYVTKPFGLHELLARLRTALRHARRPDDGSMAPVFATGDVTVDLERRLVRRKDQEIRLTATEYKLLATLIKHAGKVLTHRQLLKEVWGPLHVEEAHYLRVYMRQLRNKLETNPAHPSHLVTEVGVGYRLRID